MNPGLAVGVPVLGSGAPAVGPVPPDRDAGLRRGEAWLQWGDLDLDNGVAYLSRQLRQDASGRLKQCPLKPPCPARPEDRITLTGRDSRAFRMHKAGNRNNVILGLVPHWVHRGPTRAVKTTELALK